MINILADIQTGRDNLPGVFNITMFGSFDIEYCGKHMIQNIGRSKKLNALLAYLLYNKGKIISQSDIINHIWPEGHNLDPINALKNLVYRLRKLLVKESGFPDLEYIVFAKNTYFWNTEINIKVDIEDFTEYIRIASLRDTPDELKIKLLNKAFDLYKGEFLTALIGETWVLSLATYYFNMFLSCVQHLTELNEKEKKFNENIDICYKALSYNPFEEHLHLYLIKTFVKSGLLNKAISHYDYMSAMFYKELGITPSEELKLAYKEIIAKTDFEESDIETIKEELSERTEIKGAYFCDYDTFKHIYRIEARSMQRSGLAIYICLLTMVNQNGSADEKIIRNIVRSFGENILACLRRGDVFAKYGKNQYVVMLKSITFENCEMVMKRILKRFSKESASKYYKVNYKFMPLDPVVQ